MVTSGRYDHTHSFGCLRPCRGRNLCNAGTTQPSSPIRISAKKWRACLRRFVLIGIAFALGYPRHRLLAASLTAVMTGVLELLQLFVPGRHARVEDFLVDASATLAGFVIVSIIDLAITAMRGSKPT